MHARKNVLILTVLLAALMPPMMTGCGVAVGAAGAGAGYEYQNKQQLEMLEDDYKAGNIDKDEYLKAGRILKAAR